MRKEYYNGCLRMKKYIKSYIDYVDDVLNNNKNFNYKKLEEEHLIKISFFQHERLVHLLVTLCCWKEIININFIKFCAYTINSTNSLHDSCWIPR